MEFHAYLCRSRILNHHTVGCVDGAGGESIPYMGYIFVTMSLPGMHPIAIPVLATKTKHYHDAVPLLVGNNYLSIAEVSSSQDVLCMLRVVHQAAKLANQLIEKSKCVYGTI